MNDPDIPATAEELRADRDLARDELSRSVADLGAKLDVPERAGRAVHEQADQVRERASAVADQAKKGVAAVADRARAAAEHTREAVERAPSEPVRDAGVHAAETVRRNRLPVVAIAAGGAAVAGWWVIRRRAARTR